MRQSFSIAVLPLGAIAALALSACSSGESDAAASPTPTVVSAAQWADSICTSLGDVITSIDSVTDGLSVEIGSGAPLDQVRSQLQTNTAAVEASVEDLMSTIADPPESQEAQALRETLQNGADDVSSATQDAQDAVQAAAAATTAAEFLDAAGTALTATSTAMSTAQAFSSTVASAGSSAGDTLRSAFADTASCKSLTNTQ